MLGQFAELMHQVAQISGEVKIFEELFATSDAGVQEILAGSRPEIEVLARQQQETLKNTKAALRAQLDAVAAKLRANGQGFAITGYEERLAALE